MNLENIDLENNIGQSLMNLNLEYMMNAYQYKKYLNEKNPEIKKDNRRDKRFYKKRVFELTKQLLNNEKPNRMTSNLKLSFDNYVKSSIEYLKLLDTIDILQEEYIGNDLEKDIVNTEPLIVDDLLLSSKCFTLSKIPTLTDNFIKIKQKKKKEIWIPVQKEIDLKNPQLKIKGITKKINITNKYEDPQDQKVETETEPKNENSK
jgi:hypothetical protein